MTRRRRKKPGTAEWWSDNQRLEAVTAYVATGSPSKVCTALAIPVPTFMRWKTQQWFKDLLEQIKSQETLELDAKMSKLINKALDAVGDRIENGNVQFDQKTGQMRRVPVSLRDLSKSATEILDKQHRIRQQPEKAEIDKTIDARLGKLAEEFAKFSRGKNIEATLVTTTYEVIDDKS